MSELKKKISSIEWDIEHMEDKGMRARKIELLKTLKEQLRLEEQDGKN
ncbi:hypothetical protein H6503_04130 [Candidatus Woesearchaeota archaeon]|nr:hypothetical protein [Candidatus Woesearchaeota archaeon]